MKTSSPEKSYPFQNLSLENIKGESWKDIPGLDGYFVISNFGRVRRMEYEVQYKNGAIYTKPERIIKPYIVKQPNRFKKDELSYLCNKVILAGRAYHLPVARLVYYCFVETFDLDDHKIVILTRDYDNFNIKPSNIIKANRQKKQERMIKRGRFRTPFLEYTESDRQLFRQKIVHATSKQVSQYSKEGIYIETYSSAADAEKATGIKAQSIGKVTNRKSKSAGGFIWRLGDAKQIEVEVETEDARRKLYRLKLGVKVTQYDMQGNRLARFPSLKDAAEQTGIGATAIGQVINGICKSAKGYFWVRGYGRSKIDLSSHQYGRASMAITQSKAVEQYDLSGKYIATFASVKNAAAAMGVYSGSVSDACRGVQKSCRGYLWKFSNDV